VLRNALRYTISAREYATLHRYVLSRSRVLRRAAPSVAAVERMMDGEAGAQRRGAEGGREAGRVSDKGKARADVGGPVAVGAGDDFNARAVRHSLRVFFGTAVAMKAYGVISTRLMGGKKEYVPLLICLTSRSPAHNPDMG